MAHLTSFGTEKALIRKAVSVEFMQMREGVWVMLDVVGGCLDTWLDDAVVLNNLPDTIVLVNKDPTECERLVTVTAQRLHHTNTTVLVVCDDIYSYLSSLPDSSVSALFSDHNQSVAFLEKVKFDETIRRACMHGAFVAITTSLRIGKSIPRLRLLVQGLGVFSTRTPFTYNTKGPMSYTSGRVCKPSAAVVASAASPSDAKKTKAKRKIDDEFEIETLLRKSKTRPFVKTDLQPGSLVECGSNNRWLFVIDKQETVSVDRFDVKCFGKGNVLHMAIDIKDVKRIATNVPKELVSI